MSVLVYIESDNGTIKKAALEVASYGRALANTLNTSLSAIIFSSENSELLGTYGVDKVLTVDFSGKFNAKIYADIITQAAQKEQILKQILTPEARMRLNNIKMVKPELSDLVEQYLIGMATQGKMPGQINDDQLKQILLSTQQPKRDFKINRV